MYILNSKMNKSGTEPKINHRVYLGKMKLGYLFFVTYIFTRGEVLVNTQYFLEHLIFLRKSIQQLF